MPLAAGTRIGPYEVLAPLGAGGMGEVYRAVDTRLGRHVAVKISTGEFTGRFRSEARAISALNHPHICTLYDVGPNFLVMELVEGETLAARLKKGKLSTKDTLLYGGQIAAALAEAHTKGVVHRDLKPGNVMIDKNGAKVLDFGLAKSSGDETVTITQAVMGTPAYMAPEQREGQECDARTDIYALGLVLYEMCCGKRAPQGERPALDALPERLAHVIERCLEYNPEGRWQTARDLRAELEWAAQPARGAESVSRSKRPPHQAAWIVAAALLIALVTLALVHFRERPPEARVVRSTILPPEKTTFSFPTSRGPVALSPDGRRMVFAATGEDGKSQLWVRLLEADTAQLLPGTEGGTFPFWSPDSRFVAFIVDGRLKKIDTQGGVPVTLADVDAGQQGSWSSNGTILFSKDSGPLWKISSAGGSAVRATAPDERGETSHWSPWFLPDGEHFLFLSRANLLVGSLGSTAIQIVAQADSNGMYAEGRLLFLKGTTLMAQPFDVKALRTTGDAVPVVQDIEGFSSPGISGVFSVSTTGLLAYQNGGGEQRRQLSWLDRSGKTLSTIGEPLAFRNLALSPDRKSLAASALDASGNQNLWTYNLGNGLATRFTNDRFAEFGPVWSPDGGAIAFSSQRAGQTGVYRKPANGSGPEELLYADHIAKTPTSWSPDGKFLLYYTSTDGPTLADVWALPLTPERPGAPLKAVPFIQTPGNERFPQVSPDGRWVAYDQDTPQGRQIFVSPVSRPAERRQISTNRGFKPRWRPDGKEIFYQMPPERFMAAELRIAGDTVEVVAMRQLFDGFPTSGGYLYDVSADGQRILAAIPVGSLNARYPITLVQNWAAGLKK